MPVEKRNIFLQETRDTLPFVSKRGRSGTTFPVRTDPGAHAAFISRKLTECREQDLTQRQVAAIRYKDGLYLEFSDFLILDKMVTQQEPRYTFLLAKKITFSNEYKHLAIH